MNLDGDCLFEQYCFTAENAEDAEKKKLNEFSALSASSAVENLSSRPQFMTVATTRPETMLGDTAVAVHSEDGRWNWAIGKRVRLPLTGRTIPIIAQEADHRGTLRHPTLG